MKRKILILVGVLVLIQVTIYILFSGKEDPVFGKISTAIRIYENANEGVSDVNFVEISTLYFKNNHIIEELPSEYYQSERYCVIKDENYSDYCNNLDGIVHIELRNNVYNKKKGALFVYDSIPYYSQRVNMTDTILDGTYFKRFYINTQNDFAVFYIAQDKKKIPYSLNKMADKDYKGRLSRIDTYQRDVDRFTSFRMSVSDTIPDIIYNTLNELK